MRVSFVALNYAPSTGGAQEHIRRLAEGLAARGHQVEVLTTDAVRLPVGRSPGKIPVRSEVLDGVSVRRFPTPAVITGLLRAGWFVQTRWYHHVLRRPPRLLSPWLMGPFPPGQVRAVRQAMRSSDVVVGCSAPFATLLVPVWFRRRAQARIAAMPMLHVAADGVHPAAARAMRRSDRVMAFTTSEAEVQADLGVLPARVRVIPPGTDPGAFPRIAPDEARRQLGLPERPTVGFIGRLAAYKGVDTLLAAAPALWERHPDTTVLVAGSPSGWDRTTSDATAATGGDRFVLREGFAADERALLLAACDVVVHPSREESFGLIALEAWAARRPVVLAAIPCVRSFVEPGVAAELIEPGDHVALARILGDLLDDPVAREQMGAAGRELVEDQYGWDTICDQWDRELSTLVQEGG